jgi:hypothetical protein
LNHVHRTVLLIQSKYERSVFMKNKCKLLGIAVVIAAIVFGTALLFTGCDDVSKKVDSEGESKENSGGGIFTSSNAFNEWLSKQPDNTPSTAYTVRLSVDYLDIYLSSYKTKYIILDLTGSTITSFGWAQFSGCTNLVGIIIPDSVTSIDGNVFSGCTGLTSVIIPDSVTGIGRWAFSSCTGLNNVTIGNGVTGIEYGAFYECTNLTSVIIGNGVISIDGADHPSWGDKGVFENCTKLTNVTIGNSVKNIGGSAFAGCTSLKEIIIPNSVTSIGGSAFYHCTGLTSVIIGNGVTSIGGWAFSDCNNLASIIIPNGNIENYAFYGYIGLISLTIGSGVTIDGYNFEDCTSLTSVTFQGNTNYISEWFVFPGDLRDKYLAEDGGAGTYTRLSGDDTWTKQP